MPVQMLTPEIQIVLVILALALVLFVSEIVRVDIAAILVMLLIGSAGQLPGVSPLLDNSQLFSGFSSNAVLAIIGIMIIGAGLDKAGLMAKLAAALLRLGRPTERRIVARVSASIGLISSFMQNVGATALFLPAVSRISTHTGIPLSRLLMPTGFCAILGGTLTMVGCSSLIVLNDLISSADTPAGMPALHRFGLFDVTPIGLALLGSGIIFFTLAGKRLLPALGSSARNQPVDAAYLHHTYGLEVALFETRVSADSPIAGKTIRDIEEVENAAQILSFHSGSKTRVSPSRDEIVWPGSQLLLLGPPAALQRFAAANRLPLEEIDLQGFNQHAETTGIAEVVIPPGSQLIGRSIGELRLRKHHNASLIGLHRNEKTVQGNLRGWVLKAGDTLLLYSRWQDIANLAHNRDFAVASDYPKVIAKPHKLGRALACFCLAMGLVLFTDLSLAFILLCGALAMVICGVISMDEAYQAVSWKTVFLLASLIPLGSAVNHTGTAAWLAQLLLYWVDDIPAWGVQTALALLASALTLVISNVGTTVLLAPIAISLARQLGADPSVFALTVALATSNSFLIPTHQVNALIMGPAGYRVADFTRVGGIMSVIYLAVLIPMLNLVF